MKQNILSGYKSVLLAAADSLIRCWFSKGTDFARISDREIQKVENRINNHSMNVLAWKSHNQLYNELMAVAVYFRFCVNNKYLLILHHKI